jgi:uncharacterized protein YbcI
MLASETCQNPVLMEHTHSPEHGAQAGEQLAAVTNGIVKLFRDYYGRGPTKAKSYILDDRIVVCVLENTMTRVEKTLVDNGHGSKVREVRLVFQEAMAHEFKQCVRDTLGREVMAYHSQLTLDPDLGFEFFVLEA